MSLEQLRALLREKIAGLAALKTKAFGDGATETDEKSLEAAIKEIEDLEKKIDLAEKAEALEAKASKPADAPVGDQRPTAPAAPEQKMDETQRLSLVAASIIKGKADGAHPLKVLEDAGYGQYAKELRQKAVNTQVSSEGGILVPTDLQGGIIPLLRVQSTFLGAGPMRVRFTNGSFKQPRGATGATASYVAEGARKPVSTPTFDAIDMKAKKLAGIVPLTNEAKKWTVGDIEGYVREDLRDKLALTMDLHAYFGTGAGDSPTGIFNKSGVQTVTPTIASPTAPTLSELDRLATAMILRMTTANLYTNGKWRWVMSYRTAMFLADIRTESGDKAFPEMEGMNPVWKKIPVIVTNQVATNGGATLDETTLGLVDFSHVLFGEESGIVMKMSDQATLDPDGTGENLIHLFQQNMFAILAESEHDFGLRYAKAVVKAAGIRF